MAIGGLLLSLFFVTECAKEFSLQKTTLSESKTPSVVKMDEKKPASEEAAVEDAGPEAQETEPEPAPAVTPEPDETVSAAAESLQEASSWTAPEMTVPEPQKATRDQSFHLKPIEAPSPPKKEEMTPVSPKILEDKTVETKMPQVVANLAAKAQMYHSIHSPIKEDESCVTAKCHNQITKTKYVHAPVAAKACLVCHANIRKDPPFGLVSTAVDLCWGCHKNQKLSVINSKYLHKILKNEGCIGCHDSHGSNKTKYLLKKNELTLCVDCHKNETKKVMKHIESSTVIHKPVAEGRCASCHAPHASNFKKLLKEGPNDTALCFSCHKKMEEQAKLALYKHGPIRQELCSPCHEPHAGLYAKDLKYNFEKKFYNPFDLEVYSLCFKCHKEAVVLDKRTTYLTNFRNGDRNLHFLHVNREKGRTCLACHEVHMGSQMRHIRKSTPFGNWEIPINFIRTSTGGKCSANCHVPKEYDREEPFKLLIDEEEEKLVVGKKAAG
jgi:predicted CXXCH cytochrome family protein